MAKNNDLEFNTLNSQFIPPRPLRVPVLFVVFNRLDVVIQVFGAIRKAKPPKLYIAADGARESKIGEREIVRAVRDYIMSNIDWECETKTLFHEQNLSCKMAVSGAIDWFFENEEMGIILEDDCLPNQSFFWFCERMLNEYQDNKSVMMITGTNHMLNIRNQLDKDYFFSRYFAIWGWATWKRAWKLFDINIPTWRNQIGTKDLSFISSKRYVKKYYTSIFDAVYYDQLNTWATPWVYYCFFNYGLCLTPSINMISNIGIEGVHSNGVATHNHFLLSTDFQNIDSIKINPLVYPEQSYDERAIYVYNGKLPGYITMILSFLLKKIGLYKSIRYIYRLFR